MGTLTRAELDVLMGIERHKIRALELKLLELRRRGRKPDDVVVENVKEQQVVVGPDAGLNDASFSAASLLGVPAAAPDGGVALSAECRSEERRVGKECRSR